MYYIYISLLLLLAITASVRAAICQSSASYAICRFVWHTAPLEKARNKMVVVEWSKQDFILIIVMTLILPKYSFAMNLISFLYIHQNLTLILVRI